MNANQLDRIAGIRRQLCQSCPSPCPEITQGRIAWNNPAQACPAGRWASCVHPDADAGGLIQAVKAGRYGDAVAVVAQPIAGAVDRVFGTDFKNCGGCKRRQEALNRLGEKNSTVAPK
jgi:hypothetical protein